MRKNSIAFYTKTDKKQDVLGGGKRGAMCEPRLFHPALFGFYACAGTKAPTQLLHRLLRLLHISRFSEISVLLCHVGFARRWAAKGVQCEQTHCRIFCFYVNNYLTGSWLL